MAIFGINSRTQNRAEQSKNRARISESDRNTLQKILCVMHLPSAAFNS